MPYRFIETTSFNGFLITNWGRIRMKFLPGRIFGHLSGQPRGIMNRMHDAAAGSDIGSPLIPKLADPDSSCVNSSGTSNAKNVRWFNEIWAQRSSADVGKDESRFPQFGISEHSYDWNPIGQTQCLSAKSLGLLFHNAVQNAF
jgi:hypothetical protein